MSADQQPLARLDELLVDRATEGLDRDAQRELDRLLAEAGESDVDGFDRAAAALELAIAAQYATEPLPTDLADKIAADALKHVGPEISDFGAAAPSAPAEVGGDRLDAVPEGWPPEVEPREAGGLRLVAAAGWIAAAAACVALVVVWRSSRGEVTESFERIAALDAQLTSARSATETAQLDAANARQSAEQALAAARQLETDLTAERDRSVALSAERQSAQERQQSLAAQLDDAVAREIQLEDRVADLEELLYEPSPEVGLAGLLDAAPDDLLRLPWSTTADPLVADATVAGEVIWSDSLQVGFMVFESLPVNAVAEAQYQLWIFSSDQKESTPVDGGVFDSASTGRIVVPIDPKLGVRTPSLFAVTVEKPGGVVVSERDRLILAAPL